jgi:flagellar motility protein MotE (MotC chaperone)
MKSPYFTMILEKINHPFNQYSIPMKTISKTLLTIVTTLILAQHAHAASEDVEKDSFSSVEERRIDSTILQERANIRKEREDMDLHKKELKSLEEGVDKKLGDIDRKLEELRNLQKKIEILLAAKSADEKKRIQNLAGIYEKMLPAKAALALSGLEQQLAADLLASMKTKAAAKILDQIAKQKATELSTTFSTLQLE